MRPGWGLAAIVAVSLTRPAVAADDAVVAQSGAQTMTMGAVRKLLDEAGPDARKQAGANPEALAQLVRTEMLRQRLLEEARSKKWDAQPDVAAKIARARDAVTVSTYVASLTEPPASFPSDAEIDAAFETNKPKFMVPRQYHLQQIFIPVGSGAAPSANDDAQKALRDARAALLKPKADFTETAGKVAGAARLETGGDLGWVREDQMIPAVRDAITGLQEGGVSDPVRSADGWHLLKLLGTKPAAPADKAEVRDALVRALRDQRRAQNERALLAEAQRRQPIQIDEIQLSKAAR